MGLEVSPFFCRVEAPMSTTVVKQHYQDETVARDYDRERFTNLAGHWFDRLEKRALRRVIRHAARAANAPRVLDVPCGTGRITELLLQEGLHTVGGDISEQMIDMARGKLRRFGEQAAFQRLDLDALDLPDDSFEIVTCIRLFHHLDTVARAAVLKELARVTRRYVIVNISYSSQYYRLRRRMKRWFGQSVSRTSSRWYQMHREAVDAGLVVRRCRLVLPGVSEDMVVLLEKMK